MKNILNIQAEKENEVFKRWINLIDIRTRFQEEMEELGAYSDENKRILRELTHQIKGGPDRMMKIDNLKIDIKL